MSYPEPSLDDPVLKNQMKRLHELIVWSRWLVIILLWLVIGSLSLWGMRSDISLLMEHFTWATVRHGLFHNRLSAIGLGICLGMTTSTLLWQSRNILIGFPPSYRQRLERQVLKIRQQGSTHPLWRWVINNYS
ncbi:hypothetical protein B9T16_02155 [Arthrospira sp. PCC 8006]|nr:hypothetical protein [Arthrospira sp. PLM2.Bin9]TVU55451.1 MAG: hypothetical protein EA414_01640 [Arthrospira sp. PLM2.Bin9]